jgi:hypothetical protein
MGSYVTVHLHNPAPQKEDELARWFTGTHAGILPKLRGFKQVDRFEITERQTPVCPVQPWRYMSLYELEFENPEIHVPALGSFLADARDAGLVALDGSECIWSYGMYSGWKYSSNWKPAEELSHVMMLPANFIYGREAEYQKWYDEVHTWEVAEVPGFVGMRRGRLLNQDIQIEPRNFCPGSQLILNGAQTGDFEAALDEFIARAYGKSKTPHLNHGPRHPSASVARTVHCFRRIATLRPPRSK